MANEKNKPGQQDTGKKEQPGVQQTPEKGKGLGDKQTQKPEREEETESEELDQQ